MLVLHFYGLSTRPAPIAGRNYDFMLGSTSDPAPLRANRVKESSPRFGIASVRDPSPDQRGGRRSAAPKPESLPDYSPRRLDGPRTSAQLIGAHGLERGLNLRSHLVLHTSLLHKNVETDHRFTWTPQVWCQERDIRLQSAPTMLQHTATLGSGAARQGRGMAWQLVRFRPS